jgi:cation diffusion facilitator CzcD-associated flavoprotein CzcO/acetyl esterase/lipase
MPLRLQRRLIDVAMGAGPLARGVTETRAVLGGVPGSWLRPADAGPGALLLLHGGAFMTGSSRSHRRLAARLAARLRIPVFTVDYRLAPEYPFPAGLDDARRAYDALVATGVAPSSLILVGDSAGGGLALALAQQLRDARRPLPAVIGLLSPWLDLVPDGDGTRATLPHDPLLGNGLLRDATACYAGGSPGDPRISPLRGDLSHLPPIVAVAATGDPLAADVESLERRLPGVEILRVAGAWHGFHLHEGLLPGVRVALERFADAMAARLPSLRVGIIGAGVSGLCMATRLREGGYEDVVIYEKAAELGGTWRENRYPGLTCDVPSRFYSYSFAPKADWSQLMAGGPEILDYLKGFADERDLRRLIRFDSEVVEARWTGTRWRVLTADGEADEVDVLVTATGFLHHPRLPEIEGLDSFEGLAMHSARWDPQTAVEGKRVGVIGTGSTGVQLTTGLAPQVGHLSVFQRTPQWILTLPNRSNSALTRRAFQRLPWLNGVAYRAYRKLFESTLGVAAVRPGWQRSVMVTYVRSCLRRGVKDPELRRRLTPDYVPLCKRIVVSGTFYETMQRENVELVTEGIARIVPRGVVTTDGQLHELDVLVFATGFDALAFMRPMQIEGGDGVTLDETWKDGPFAYRTIAIPGFPNLFTLVGPHSPVGNQSIMGVAETQTRYVMQWIDKLSRDGIAWASPREDATQRYNDERREAAPHTIAATGCTSWYTGPNGTVEIWPWTPDDHRRMLREPNLDEWIVQARTAAHTVSDDAGRVGAGASAE